MICHLCIRQRLIPVSICHVLHIAIINNFAHDCYYDVTMYLQFLILFIISGYFLQARLEKLQNEISQVAKKTGISSAAKLAQLEQRDIKSTTDGCPDVEWWDAVILKGNR